MTSEISFNLSGVIRVNKRGQVVLPKDIKDKAGIKAGDKLVILACEDNGKFFVIVKDAERAVHDSLCVVADVFKDNQIVTGGGAVEEEIARRLREYAPTVGGREQLAFEKYAEALETIPRTLAENTGLDPLDILVNLRTAHENDQKRAGVDVYGRKVGDMFELGVVEPLSIKAHALKSATETANMILRIDEIIVAKGGKY